MKRKKRAIRAKQTKQADSIKRKKHKKAMYQRRKKKKYEEDVYQIRKTQKPQWLQKFELKHYDTLCTLREFVIKEKKSLRRFYLTFCIVSFNILLIISIPHIKELGLWGFLLFCIPSIPGWIIIKLEEYLLFVFDS